MRPEALLHPTPAGLYCPPGDFHVDPVRAVDRAVITHGHADHARPGHRAVLATAETLAIARLRLGEMPGEALAYGEAKRIGEVEVRLVPAGHVLGSAQVVLECAGLRIVVSGDYKRSPDPTCPLFEPVDADVFVTEATFGLPVFHHPPAEQEIRRLLHSAEVFADRCHLVGAYSLGKAQRLIRLLRLAGYERPIWLHGAMVAMCELYESFGVGLGALRQVAEAPKGTDFAGEIVIAPPSALGDRWSRRLGDPVTAMASGWMSIRARARQRGAELPLVISDHADWDELTRTIDDVPSAEIWVTHGREEALVRHARLVGREAKALSLVGYEDESE